MFGQVTLTRDPDSYDPANPTNDPTLETTTPDFARWTRDHWSCLLYLETRIVDHGGKVERHQPQMNSDDWAAIDDFVGLGLLVWGGTGMHPIFSFTDAGWAVTHAIRRSRAEGIPHDSSRAAVAAAAFLRASEIERLREQVAFYRGCAAVAAEQDGNE